METQPISIGPEGARLFRVPTGNNDIYWCKALNSPTVIRNGGNVCERCGQRLADDPNPHVFVAHIEW
jgi:hypothetical protein